MQGGDRIADLPSRFEAVAWLFVCSLFQSPSTVFPVFLAIPPKNWNSLTCQRNELYILSLPPTGSVREGRQHPRRLSLFRAFFSSRKESGPASACWQSKHIGRLHMDIEELIPYAGHEILLGIPQTLHTV